MAVNKALHLQVQLLDVQSSVSVQAELTAHSGTVVLGMRPQSRLRIFGCISTILCLLLLFISFAF